MPQQVDSLYAAAGGAEAIHQLVDAFYTRVAAHPVLRPLFPDDFTEIRAKQTAFLTQFFGGPALYSSEYGTPMLRLRHLRIAIGQQQAAAWLDCMAAALADTNIRGPLYDVMWDRLQRTALHMVNLPPPEAIADQRRTSGGARK